jgi:DNA-binding Lrp family transcriptional regulator
VKRPDRSGIQVSKFKRQGFPEREKMDEVDKKILNEIQSDFPVVSRPYYQVAKRLSLSEAQVIERIKALKGEGVIRRIGANFSSGRLGFTSILCAAKVRKEEMDHFVDVVNEYSGVTHNYLREHEYNIWFTFIARDMKYINHALRKISDATGVKDILNLPAIKTFKIKVDFEV